MLENTVKKEFSVFRSYQSMHEALCHAHLAETLNNEYWNLNNDENTEHGRKCVGIQMTKHGV